MKRVLRITLESVEVEDGYIPSTKGEESGDVVVIETDGNLYMGSTANSEMLFLAVSPDLLQVSALAQFVYWASVAWRAFSDKLPQRLKDWMFVFTNLAGDPVAWAINFGVESMHRKDEVRSKQINFAKYNPYLFPPTTHWWSRN